MSGYAFWALTIFSGVYLAGNFRMAIVGMKQVVPYSILCFVSLLVASAASAIGGVGIEDNLAALGVNTFQTVRNSLFGVVGLVMFSLNGFLGPLQSLEEGFLFAKRLPRSLVPSIVVGYLLYTIVLFVCFIPNVFSSGKVAIASYLFTISFGVSGAINDELLFRLCLIGVIVHFCRHLRIRWHLGIVLSTLMWVGLQLDVGGDMAWLKVVQILPLGLALGIVLMKFGFESSVLVHCMVNIVNGTVFSLIGLSQ